MNTIKLISMLLIRKNILQNPLIINNTKILIYSKSFPFPKYNFKLCTNRYFSDKCPDDAAKGKSPPAKPDAKAAAKKTDAKAGANKPDPKKVQAKAPPAKKPAQKPPPKVTKPSIDKKAVARMAELQLKFQKNDGKPVFLKMGFRDMILYRTTCGLAIVGLLGCVILYLSLIFK